MTDCCSFLIASSDLVASGKPMEEQIPGNSSISDDKSPGADASCHMAVWIHSGLPPSRNAWEGVVGFCKPRNPGGTVVGPRFRILIKSLAQQAQTERWVIRTVVETCLAELSR